MHLGDDLKMGERPTRSPFHVRQTCYTDITSEKLDTLARAQKRVATGEASVAKQFETIRAMQERGRDTSEAQANLDLMMRTLDIFRSHLVTTIESELAALRQSRYLPVRQITHGSPAATPTVRSHLTTKA